MKRTAVLVAVCLILGIACDGLDAKEDPARAETERMLRSITVPSTAAIYVAEEPLAASQTVRLIDELRGEHTVTTGPDEQTWFFLVDLHPGERRAHPVKWVFLSDAEVRWYDREWFSWLDGTGGWEAVRLIDVGDNPAVVIRALQAPTSVEEHPAGASMRTVAQTVNGKRKAVVIDGGDEWIQFPPGLTRDELWKKFERIDAKIEFARQAEAFAEALTAHGYSVERLSGLATRIGADGKPAGASALPPPSPDRIAKAIADQANGLGAGDELVLYFGGHGNESGIVLSDKAFGVGLLSYAALNAMLEQVAPGVKKTVVLDSCASGAAADHLKGVQLHYAARGPLPGVKDANGEPDKGGTARVGLGAEDSYTETLLGWLGKPGEEEDPIGSAAVFADMANSDRGANTVTRAAALPPVPTLDLDAVLGQVREQWAKQNVGLTMNPPTCTPSGRVQIPASVACTYTDSAKNTGKIALEIKADSSWTWKASASAWHTDHLRAIASKQFVEQVGRSMQSISCGRSGLVPVPTTFSCTYTDPSTGPGTLTFTISADGSWRWQAGPTQAATSAPTAAATPARTSAPAAFSPSFQIRIRLGCGGDSRLFFTVPAGMRDALSRISATPSAFSFSHSATRSDTIFQPCTASGTITVHRSTAYAWSVTMDATITTGGYGSGVWLEVTPLGGSTSLAVTCNTSSSGSGVTAQAIVAFRNGRCDTGGSYSGTNPAGADTFGTLVVRDQDKGKVTGATGRAQITFTLTPN